MTLEWGAVGLREEKKQEQRHAILDTAVALFQQRGFHETRVRDVTARLRISDGTFFNYFPTKEAVLDAAAVALLDRVTVLLHHDATGDDRPVADRLQEVVAAFATSFAGDPDFAALLARHTQFFLARWSEQQWQERAYQPLTLLFEDGQRSGEVRPDVPASQLAELYIGATLTTISNWLAGSPGDEPLHQRLLHTWAVIRDGALTPPPTTRPSRPGQRPKLVAR